MNLPEIMVGCDPEVFLSREPKPRSEKQIERMYKAYVLDAESFNREWPWAEEPVLAFEEWKLKRLLPPPRPFVSADGLIPGTKKEPFKVDDGAIQVDGVALEFNIDPAKTAAEFSGRIIHVLEQMKAKLNRPDLQFEFKPTATFSKTVWKRIPDEAKVLGCEPDYNGYTLEANPKPETDKPFRTASGHIHVSWTSGKDVSSGAHINDCGLVAKQMDLILGVFSPGWDKDNTRRTLYGMPGAFRPKPYGMEYRSLSNAWVGRPEMYPTIFHNAKLAVKLLFKGRYLPALFPRLSENIQTEGFTSVYDGDSFWDLKDYLYRKSWIETPGV